MSDESSLIKVFLALVPTAPPKCEALVDATC